MSFVTHNFISIAVSAVTE